MSSNNTNNVQFSKMGRTVVDSYSRRGEMAQISDVVALGLEPEDSDKIYVCDRFEHLSMFHYRQGQAYYNKTNVSTKNIIETNAKESQKDPNKISNIRGLVVDTETNEICCRSFSETELNIVNPLEIEKYSNEGYTFKPFVEGATLRLFWDKITEHWFFSTHKKIDCSRSKIPGVELGFMDMFNQACPDFDLNELNKDYVYIIQVMHRDNQIMNQEVVDTPICYHLATLKGRGKMEDLNIIHNDVKLKGLSYLPDLTLDEAIGELQMRKCIIASKEFDIIQLAPQSIQKLIEIRHYSEVPYLPVELMYLRLDVSDRKYLIDALPPHQKELASPFRMDRWINSNIDELSKFCANILQNKIRGNFVSISKTLKWLVDKVVLKNKNSHYEFIKMSYEIIIREMSLKNGETFHRCIKDMKSTKKIISKYGFSKDKRKKSKTRPPKPQKSTNMVDKFISKLNN